MARRRISGYRSGMVSEGQKAEKPKAAIGVAC
jgi:hypothetical protein